MILTIDVRIYVLSTFQVKQKNFQNSLQRFMKSAHFLGVRDVSHIGGSQIKKSVIVCCTQQLLGKEIASFWIAVPD